LVKPGNNKKKTNQNVEEVSARSTQQNINLEMKCHNYIISRDQLLHLSNNQTKFQYN